jgi:signal transduction histidine kinase
MDCIGQRDLSVLYSDSLQLQPDSTVADLPAHHYRVSGTVPGHAVEEELERRPDLPGVIVDNGEGRPALISRNRFYQTMSRGFSREIFLKRPVEVLLRAIPYEALRIPSTCQISTAAAAAMERTPQEVFEPALIESPENELRILDVHVLLLAQTQLLALANQIIHKQKEDTEAANLALREAQAALIQSEKLASLGQLAAGISHEINNPVAFVSNNLAVMQREVKGALHLLDLYRDCRIRLEEIDPEHAEKLAHLEEEIDLEYTQAHLSRQFQSTQDGLRRVKDIVSNLCDFARLDRAEWQDVDLRSYLQSTIEIVRFELQRKSVKLETTFKEVPLVFVQPGKINQVFLNLLLNAIQASAPGDVIEASTHTEPSGGICIEVKDHGCGIHPDHLPRVFEPFFTTKPVGQGTGLGLSVSYGIIREHGGEIEVKSKVGQGSIFRVRLPLRRVASLHPSHAFA